VSLDREYKAARRRWWIWAGAAAVAFAVTGPAALDGSWRPAAAVASVFAGIALVVWRTGRGRSVPSPVQRRAAPARLWQRRRMQRAAMAMLLRPDLSIEARYELVWVIWGHGGPDRIADLRALLEIEQLPAELRLEIAAILADYSTAPTAEALRRIATDPAAPTPTRLEAADRLGAAGDPATAREVLAGLVTDPSAPDAARLEAALIHTDREIEDRPAGGGDRPGAMLVFLARGDAATSLTLRMDAAMHLVSVDPDQYERTMWTLANDSALAADYRLQVAAWLAAERPERAAATYLALAHDPALAWAARVEAAARLRRWDEAGGTSALESFLADPTLDDRARFDAVRNLTTPAQPRRANPSD